MKCLIQKLNKPSPAVMTTSHITSSIFSDLLGNLRGPQVWYKFCKQNYPIRIPAELRVSLIKFPVMSFSFLSLLYDSALNYAVSITFQITTNTTFTTNFVYNLGLGDP